MTMLMRPVIGERCAPYAEAFASLFASVLAMAGTCFVPRGVSPVATMIGAGIIGERHMAHLGNECAVFRKHHWYNNTRFTANWRC